MNHIMKESHQPGVSIAAATKIRANAASRRAGVSGHCGFVGMVIHSSQSRGEAHRVEQSPQSLTPSHRVANQRNVASVEPKSSLTDTQQLVDGSPASIPAAEQGWLTNETYSGATRAERKEQKGG
jgi:hypothetical protein